MATLMSVIQPVPPVIRKRAKELLDVIKASVTSRSNMSTDITESNEAGNISALPVEMQVDTKPSSPFADEKAAGLWGNGKCPGTRSQT
jgi:exosome complex exonuclease RRP6